MSINVCAYKCAHMSQYISVVIIGFITVTMYNAIVANFWLLFCRMMYCQLSNTALDTGHTGFDTSLLDFTLAISDWMLASQLCSCDQLFKNQLSCCLPSVELCCHSC